MENGMKKKSITLYLFSLMLAFTTIFAGQLLAQTPSIITGWNPNEEADLSHYIIYRDSEPGTMVLLDIIPNNYTTFTDYNVELGKTYYYKLTAVDYGGNESGPSEELMAEVGSVTLVDEGTNNFVKNFELKQNYPNPFNPTTTIEYSIPYTSEVNITIYDILGREVRNLFAGTKDSGVYKVKWNGKDNKGVMVSSGIYFYQMLVKDHKVVKKAIFQE
jgi:fibronectin type 3 domain-containing protein